MNTKSHGYTDINEKTKGTVNKQSCKVSVTTHSL